MLRAMDELPKHYDPTSVESKWLEYWLERGYFHADEAASGPMFSITQPPPNVTGSLHMGHALGGTVQDILIRWQRMKGKNAMWMPGTDHAGIATQMLVERDLKRREGKSRHDIGRDKFLELTWKWKQRYGGRIHEQHRLMGFSLDWERERFTMDERSSAAVREAFVQMYEQGLIYRAHRLVNWCKDCVTALSDLEVNNVDEKGFLWEVHYPIVGSEARITVATTRPETMLGDTGVAVHPDDERYRDLIGSDVELPLVGRKIPIVADSFVDPEFGSGAVKVTPAHDANDFECGERCGLERISIIGQDGTIIAPAPDKYQGLTVEAARTAVVADLEAQGFLGETQEYTVPRGRCDRSNTVVEPLLSEQWFVKTKPMAERAIDAVETGATKFVPELWTKTYMHWMRNIRDWCISRQLWWGHRIPAWYCKCGHIDVAREAPKVCGKCGGADLKQDDDVLDTWFSSGLWPFSTLGWPEQTQALKTFYPTSVLVTGADIIFFWVARMMMMGLHFAGDVPFRTVYLTPIVTDENGDKMSKVKGNVVDPLDVVHGATVDDLVARAEDGGVSKSAIKAMRKRFPKGIDASGTDALRFTLAAMAMPGRNIRLSMERVEGYRHFINKLWNAARFVQINLDGFDANAFADQLREQGSSALGLSARWILSRLQRVSAEVEQALTEFRFSEAANVAYHFVWGEFCDWYIELAKPALLEKADQQRRLNAQGVLTTVLDVVLRLLHPIIPYVTEEIWHKLPKVGTDDAPQVDDSLMVAAFPSPNEDLIDDDAEAEMKMVQDVTVEIRTLRSTYRVPPSWKVEAEVRVAQEKSRDVVTRNQAMIENAARAKLAIIPSGGPVTKSAHGVVGANIEVVIPLSGVIDMEAEKARINKEIGKTDKEIAFVSKKLENPKFMERAPAEVVAKERARLADEQTRRKRLVKALSALDS